MCLELLSSQQPKPRSLTLSYSFVRWFVRSCIQREALRTGTSLQTSCIKFRGNRTWRPLRDLRPSYPLPAGGNYVSASVMMKQPT